MKSRQPAGKKTTEKKENPVSFYQALKFPAGFDLQSYEISQVTPSTLVYHRGFDAIQMHNKETRKTKTLDVAGSKKTVAIPGDQFAVVSLDQIHIHCGNTGDVKQTIPLELKKPLGIHRTKLSMNGQHLIAHMRSPDRTDHIFILDTASFQLMHIPFTTTLADVAIDSSDRLVVAFERGGMQFFNFDFNTKKSAACSELLVPEEMITHLWTGWDKPFLVTASSSVDDLSDLELWTMTSSSLIHKQNIATIEDVRQENCVALNNSMLFFGLKGVREFRLDTLRSHPINIKGFILLNICSVSSGFHVLLSTTAGYLIGCDFASVIAHKKMQDAKTLEAIHIALDKPMLPPLRAIVADYLKSDMRLFSSPMMTSEAESSAVSTLRKK